MPTPTYSQIFTTTLTTAANNITFSSIPNTYTDLVMIGNIVPASNGVAYLGVRVGTGNSLDTGGNYSQQQIVFTDAVCTAYQTFNETAVEVIGNQFQNNGSFTVRVDLNSYAATVAWHPIQTKISIQDNTSRQSLAIWKNSSAINTVSLLNTAGNNCLGVGSTISLFGILRA
jgi:hypothetical protein